MSEVVLWQSVWKSIPSHTFSKLSLGMGKQNQFCMFRLSYHLVKMSKFLEFRTSSQYFWKFHSPWIWLNLLLKPLMLLILHRTKWTQLQGFIGLSSVTWSFDTESGIGEANSNEKPHWKKESKFRNRKKQIFESSWTIQGWIKQRKWAMPTETYWQRSVHVIFINFVKPRTKNYRANQKLLNLGDESCEVYHSNMQQNPWFCLSSLFRLQEFKRKLLQILTNRKK